eukprot:6207775-Pleurochrysis_carterae.AAC.3
MSVAWGVGLSTCRCLALPFTGLLYSSTAIKNAPAGARLLVERLLIGYAGTLPQPLPRHAVASLNGRRRCRQRVAALSPLLLPASCPHCTFHASCICAHARCSREPSSSTDERCPSACRHSRHLGFCRRLRCPRNRAGSNPLMLCLQYA